jgi:hypothetical protein
MNWGRYAEIFDYDPDSKRLVLAEHTTEATQHPGAPVES